jgi:hypothetical protein
MPFLSADKVAVAIICVSNIHGQTHTHTRTVLYAVQRYAILHGILIVSVQKGSLYIKHLNKSESTFLSTANRHPKEHSF